MRALRLGELIGRRRELRTALAVLRGGRAARERFGALAGVLLTGVGGIGKTALAGRVLGHLADDGWVTVVHDGRWDPQMLIARVAAALADRPGLEGLAQLVRDSGVEDVAKLEVVRRLLGEGRVLLLFDDFEQNLMPGGGAFAEPGFAETFAGLCDAARTGRVLVTCRYPVPELDPYLLKVNVPPLSLAELDRLLLRLGGLLGLTPDERQVVKSTIGGHPRLLDFVDALLRQGRASLHTEVTRKLRMLAAEEGLSVSAPRGPREAVDDAILLGARDILLGQLLGLLSETERELLLQAAVSTVPLDARDLAQARWGSPTDAQTAAVELALPRLIALTLLTRV